ncbi:MAG: hypothetical protein U0704_16420 [Candidatus Eisenbacteria bacterium]
MRDSRGSLPAAFVAALLLACPVPARAHEANAWLDPLLPMIRATDRYLQEHAENGVTMDWRYSVIPSEEIRQTVVCQLLAYVELARLDARPRLRTEIVRHADFLLPRLDEVRSYTPFDGMLADALLGAYEITREPRFLAAGAAMTQDLLAIPTGECVLNGGLMVAMATAEYAMLTGDTAARGKTHDILAQLAFYQNPDGSFPHWCPGSRDIHYTGWMGMELVHVRRLQDSTLCDQYLPGMTAFLEGRIGPGGRSVYEQPCDEYPGCMEYFYSRMTGCAFDLDSRGWTVEPAYEALLFDRAGSDRYTPVMGFLDSLEAGGTIPDLFGYWPPPEDPEYPWTIADTSVVCMSINLWVLSTIAAERVARGIPIDLVLDDVVGTIGVAPDASAAPRALTATPNPFSRACVLRLARAAPEGTPVAILDACGRLVRRLRVRSGTATWDGRDPSGRACPPGVYFARLAAGPPGRACRVVLAR